MKPIHEMRKSRRAEEALRFERDRLLSALESISSFVYMQAPDYTIKYANREFRRIFGDPEGKLCYQVIRGKDRPCEPCPTFEVFKTKKTQIWQWKRNESEAYMIYDNYFLDADGFPVVLEMGLDISELRRAEEMTHRLAEVVSNASDGIVLSDPKGRTLYVNPAYEKMNGYTLSERLNRDPADLIVADDPAAIGDEIRNTVKIRGEWNGELLCRRKNGEVYPIESRVFAIKNGRGEIIEIAAIQQDITERKRSEEELLRYTMVCQSMGEALTVCTRDGIIIDINPAAEKLFGWAREELIGKTVETINPTEKANNITADINRTLQKEGVWRGEIPLVTKSGERRILSTVISCLRNKSGKWIGNIGINRDITEQKWAEEALRESEEKLRTLYKSIPVPTYTWQKREDDFVLVDCNDAAVKITRGKACDYVGKKAGEIYKDRPEILEDLSLCYTDRTPITYEMPYLLEEISEVKLLEVKYVFVPPDLILAHTEDITERKLAEKALRVSEKRFRGLFEDSPISLWEEDFSGIKEYFDILRDSGVRDFRKYFDENSEDVGKCAAMMKIVDVNKATLELYGTDDKQQFLPYLSDEFHEGTFELFKEEIIALAEGKTVFESETVIQTLKGEKKNISLKLSVAPGYEDSFSRVYVSIFDITERRRLEEQLLHAQKMEAIGTLAGGLAHDFNNILSGVLGYVSLVKRELGEESSVIKDLEGIERLSWRGSDLTKALLAFAMRGEYHPEALNVNLVIEEVLYIVSRTAGKDISIKTRFSKEVSNVFGDRGQIHQVLMNLCLNACEAMPEGGRLDLTTSNAEMDEKFYEAHSNIKRGVYVSVVVSDTGMGMDKETQEHIFEPFFTRKAKKSGTGLGLAMVNGIVARHGGCIEVESEVEEGSTFKIFLPATEEKERKVEARTGDVSRGDETILLVDDERDFRESTGRWLENLGYTVYEASSGEGAVELLKEKRDEIDLVLLDMLMKGMGGAETFKKLRAIAPGLPVIICTGYSIGADTRRLLKDGANGIFQKPFKYSLFAIKIRNIFDKS